MIRKFIFWTCLSLAVTSPSDSVAIDESGDLPPQIQQLDQQIEKLQSDRQQLLEEARKLRLKATDQDRDWKNLMGQIDRIDAQQKLLESQRRATEKAILERQAAEESVKEAEAAFEAARKKLEEVKLLLEKTTKASEAASQKQQDLEKAVTELVGKLPELNSKAAIAEKESKALHERISSMEQEAVNRKQAEMQSQQKIQDLLQAANQWVSFNDKIAPIFQERCVPCHNARNAKGQYNMATYSATLSEGQSGPAIIPGEPEASDLYNFVVDGWMPYETDPLAPEQIALIKKWIQLGARLDTSADPDALLLQLMPRVPQPEPPQTYAAPIPVTALSIDNSNTFLASSGYHEVLIWKLDSLQLNRRISNVAQRVYGVDFHPEGQLIAVASGTPGRMGEIKVFELETGKLAYDLAISEDVMFDVAYSPDGNRIATAAADGTVLVFDMNIDQETAVQDRLPVLKIEDHADWVNSVAWSADGSRLVTSSRDKTCKVFDAKTGALLITFSGHQSATNIAIFTADNKQVVSGGDDKRIRVWNAEDGSQKLEIKSLTGEISKIHLLNNNEIVAADREGRVELIALADGKQKQQITSSAGPLSALAISRSGTNVYVGNHDGLIIQSNLEDGTKTNSWQAAPPKP